MKTILLVLLLNCIMLAQVTASRVSGDTLYIKVVGLTNEIPLVIGKKNVDSLFINEARFKDNTTYDSTIILKSGIKDFNTGTIIDSIKLTDNFDSLKIYASGAGDSLSFFSAAGDSIEFWCRNMLFKAPKNLPLISEGTKKYIALPHIGREYYVDAVNGVNNPGSFYASGVKDLWYAAYLINADSSGTNILLDGNIEDSVSFANNWAFLSSYSWSMPSDVMTGYYHPASTKSLRLTSSDPTLTKPFAVQQYIHLDSAKGYSWQYLMKQTGTLALSKISIKDSASNYTYYEADYTSSGAFDWAQFGGGAGDTINATFEIIAYREDRHLDFGDVGNHWTDLGNHTLSAEDEIFYKADWSGKVTATGAGDSTANYVSLATGFSELRADTTYVLSGYFYKDENSTAVGDSVTMKFGEFDSTFALTSNWAERSFTFKASAYTYANTELKIYSNKATTFYIDHFSISYNGGDRTALVKIQGNSIQDAGVMYVDNFIIEQLVDTSIGWFAAGDALILKGDFNSDSLYLSGKYVKGTPELPIVITGNNARLLGNWTTKNGVALQEHIYGIAVNNLYIEKCFRSGIVMVSENGGIIKGTLSRLNIDSTGYWDLALGIAGTPIDKGAYMGVDIRGQYTVSDHLRVTNSGNDPFSIFGTHHTIKNGYFTGGYNAGNGDGLQLKQSGYMTVLGNDIYSLRYLKLLSGGTIPDTLGGNTYDNKAGILCNQQGGEGSDYNEIAYNKTYGFSNSLAGNVRYSNIHNNFLVNPKYNILSGSLGGGTGISMIGWGCNVYDNISIGAPIGIQLGKDPADSLVVSNNTIVNFSVYGIQVKKASVTNDKIEWYNNLVATDSTGTTILNVHNGYVPTVWDNNLYYSPENNFDFKDSTSLSAIQSLGYDLNSMNQDPLLENVFRPKYNSPAIDAGTIPLVDTDYFDNSITQQLIRDIGAVERQ